ncbi:MAG: CvpA family protein [Fidelibacterota bacterium]
MTHPIDWLSIPLLLISGYIGFKRGFLEEVARVVELIISTLISMRFFGFFHSWLQDHLRTDDIFLRIVSFTILLIICLFTIRIVTRWVQQVILEQGVELANSTVGSLFGLLRGSVIILMFLWLVEILPNTKTVGDFKGRSYLYNHSDGYRNWIRNISGMTPLANKSEEWLQKKIKEIIKPQQTSLSLDKKK